MNQRHRSVLTLRAFPALLVIWCSAAPATAQDCPRVAVQVLEVGTDAPLDGARVSICAQGGRPVGEDQTGADGWAHLLLEGSLAAGEAWVIHQGHEPARLRTTRSTEELRVELAPARGVARGVVVDGAGEPVEGAEVVATWRPGSDCTASTVFARSRAVSDAEGEFACEGVGSGESVVVAVSAEREGWLCEPAWTRQRDEEHRVLMWPLRRLRLVCLDARGRRVDAMVLLTVPDEELSRASWGEARAIMAWQEGTRTLRVDASGRTLWVPDHPIEIHARALGLAAECRRVEREEDEAVLVLSVGRKTRVRVQDEAGRPVARAAVFHAGFGAAEFEERLLELRRDIQSRQPGVRPYVAALTDSAGEANLVDLPAAGAQIIVYHPVLGATIAAWQPEEQLIDIVADGAGCGTVLATAPADPEGATGSGPVHLSLASAHPVLGATRWSSASPWRASIEPGAELSLRGVLPGDYCLTAVLNSGRLVASLRVVAGETVVAVFADEPSRSHR